MAGSAMATSKSVFSVSLICLIKSSPPTSTAPASFASNTGSQLPAYLYGAGTVIFIVGAQKIVKDSETAMKRLYDYVLPLESERAHKAYGVAGSFVSKQVTIHKEVQPNRIHIILIKEALGF
jgi:hypothetical protein